MSALALAALVAACSSAPRPAPAGRRAPEAGPVRLPPPAAAPGELADRIVEAARSLLGRPYRHSGAGLRGFDCSGLTWYLFAEAGIGLPRTAEAQSAAGRWVALDELRPGDLVFFGQNRRKPHHVGLVVSAPGEPLAMIHASTSRGVVETEVLRDPYWLPRLRFARRVLPGG